MLAMALIVAAVALGPKPPQELVQQDRLMADLRELPTSRAALGDEASRKGLEKTEELLVKKLTDLGYKPVKQEFKFALPMQPKEGEKEGAEPPPHIWHNIFVELPGTDLKDEVVLISAHFDAVPGAPGADDDGSGTAGLIEVARVLRDHPTRRTVRLVFFNLEEAGLIGSNNYVRIMKHGLPVDGSEPKPEPKAEPKADEKQADAAPHPNIVCMVSLEMLGYFSDEPNSQKSPLPPVKDVFEPPTVGDSIALVGLKKDQAMIQKFAAAMKDAAPGLKLTVVDFLPLPIPDMTRSDHRAFLMAGLPGMMLTDTANFRNPNYHKATDTVETIDQKRWTLVVKGVVGATYAVAEPVSEKP